MKKKWLCFLVAAAMLFQCGGVVFADEYFDHITLSGAFLVVRAGDAFGSRASNSVTVTKSSSQDFPTFDFQCALDMQNVRNKFNRYYDSWDSMPELGITGSWLGRLGPWLENMKVTGSFRLEISYPDSFTVPEEYFEDGQMIGFSEKAKLIFGNDRRTVTTAGGMTTVQVDVDLVGEADAEGNRPGYILAKDLKENINEDLADFTVTVEGVQSSEYGVFDVTGNMSGQTVAEGRSTTLTVDYQTDPDEFRGKVTIKEPESPSGNGGAGTVVVPSTGAPTGGDNNYLTFNVNGKPFGLGALPFRHGDVARRSDLPIPHEEGMVFTGWYFDEALTQPVPESFTVMEDLALYASFAPATPAAKLNSEEHFAYVVGYPDGTVRPNNNITREEVATIFFRLLSDAERQSVLSHENVFSDVAANRWSNTAISTMGTGEFVNGYPDGTFRPGEPITRAEFATIAARLDDMPENAYQSFTDVTGHWSEPYVAAAVQKGWITGYGDGTFHPDQNITRAEAMTMINRMLVRYVDADGLHADATRWSDNDASAWYYYAIEEATNSHAFERPEDAVYETWTSILANKDWSALEQ